MNPPGERHGDFMTMPRPRSSEPCESLIRTTQGKSTKEIISCLKRYVACELFPIITAALTPATTLPAKT